MSLPTEVILSARESLLRRCLLDCRDQIPSRPEIRFTGGWVRDKLLGVPSHDIDVALSNMTGLSFAENLRDFMTQQGAVYQEEARQIGVSVVNLKSLHQIAANPEKSKHLETITTKMFDMDLDFVNLRKETYSEASRTPQMEFGTAEEDALRRDATVNALFYNLDTQKVEDLTKLGLKDMTHGMIRTPLQPYQTFKDDPLRILRLIRFACRLHYKINPETQSAMKEQSIHQALRLKISRERVWTEVGKMFTGPDPYRALALIHELGLATPVFADPADPKSTISASPEAYNGLQFVKSHRVSLSSLLQINEEPEICWVLAAYSAYDGDRFSAEHTIRNALKPQNKLIQVLGLSVENRKTIRDVVASADPSRGRLGMFLYLLGKSWPSQVLYALLSDLAERQPLQATVEKYERFLALLETEGLMEAAVEKPILNGNEIKQALGQGVPAKHIGAAVKMVLEWQFQHKDGSKQEAAEFIEGKKEDLM